MALFRNHIKQLHKPKQVEKELRKQHTDPLVNEKILLFRDKRKVELTRQNWSQLPDAVCALANCEALSLAHNNLSDLPNDLAKLNKLVALDLSDNHLFELSKAVYRLTCLKTLSAVNNQIFDLPRSLRKLAGSMESLNLCHNRLPVMPSSLFTLANLRILRLTDNIIQAVPADIGKLTLLTELHLCNNKIRQVASEIGLLKQLRVLMIRNNEISRLPVGIGRLLVLGILGFDGNPLKFPPPDVMKGSIAEIQSYLRGADSEILVDSDTEEKEKEKGLRVRIRQRANSIRSPHKSLTHSKPYEVNQLAKIPIGEELSPESLEVREGGTVEVPLRPHLRAKRREKRRSTPNVSLDLRELVLVDETSVPLMNDGVLSPGRVEPSSPTKPKVLVLKKEAAINRPPIAKPESNLQEY